MVLSPEHVGTAGLPQEAVAGRHPDGVPGGSTKGGLLYQIIILIKYPRAELFQDKKSFVILEP